MWREFKKLSCSLTFFLFTSLFTTHSSFAVLGAVLDATLDANLDETADSIPTASDKISTVKKYTNRGTSFKIHEYTIPDPPTSSLITIKEFATQSGVVFGITWTGLSHPQIEPLLGSYTDHYRIAMKKQHRQRGQRNLHSLNTGRIVVEKWALPGQLPHTLQGRAYDPALVPQGINPHEIR